MVNLLLYHGDDAYMSRMGAGRVKMKKTYAFTNLDLTDIPGSSALQDQCRLGLETQHIVSDDQPHRPRRPEALSWLFDQRPGTVFVTG